MGESAGALVGSGVKVGSDVGVAVGSGMGVSVGGMDVAVGGAVAVASAMAAAGASEVAVAWCITGGARVPQLANMETPKTIIKPRSDRRSFTLCHRPKFMLAVLS